MIIHTVAKGDTAYTLGKQYGVPISNIIADNRLRSPSRLAVGQSLVIRQPTRTHTVRGGESLDSIGELYGIDPLELLQWNPTIADSDTGEDYPGIYPGVYPGQTLSLPEDGAGKGEIVVNGYAYPFIDRQILRRALPYLTYLSVFSYGIRPDGTVFSPGEGEEELIGLAEEYNVVPLLVLTSLTEEGTFSAELVGRMLREPALRDALIRNVVQAVETMDYGGVDVDFEYIPADLGEAYAGFVRQLEETLEDAFEEEIPVFVSLAPKTWGDQPGLLYEGHDYEALGAAAEYTLLMTYEWGYAFGPPLAVSPLPEVRRVVEYGIREIPRDKILLGVPNYGYDWQLPYVRGTTEAESLGSLEAVDRALTKNGEIRYDSSAEAPYFTYFDRPASYSDAVEHEVWFQDARSAAAMLRLVGEYRLAGIGIWNLMREFPQLWFTLIDQYRIVKLD